MFSTDISVSIIMDNSTKMKAEVCLWGVDPEEEAQVMRRIAEAAQFIIKRKEGA